METKQIQTVDGLRRIGDYIYWKDEKAKWYGVKENNIKRGGIIVNIDGDIILVQSNSSLKIIRLSRKYTDWS